MKKLIIALVLTFAAAACTVEAAEQDTEPVSEYDGGSAVTAEMLVDFSGPAMVNQFCDLYEVLGYDLSLQAFSEGYTEVDPSAQEVVDELVSRC